MFYNSEESSLVQMQKRGKDTKDIPNSLVKDIKLTTTYI